MSFLSPRPPSALSLVVEEPIAGHYYWLIVRAGTVDLRPKVLVAATGPLPSYAVALDAGIATLSMVENSAVVCMPKGQGAAWEVATAPGALSCD